MKKCILMFVFFLITLLLAVLFDNANQMIVEEGFAMGENNAELILAQECTDNGL